METILIAGGTGLVGQRLVEMIKTNYCIKILTRNPKPQKGNISYHRWDLKTMEIDPEALDTDYIINLTGAGIADQRWTEDRKKILIESRVNSNELLLQGLRTQQKVVKSFVCASAIGYYGDRGEEILTEKSPSGRGFLSKCSELWEQSADLLKNHSNRISKIRIGLVLSTNGGALPKILMTKKFGFLSYFGDGQQYYSWIHIDDLCTVFIQAILDSKYTGVINGVSPTPLTNKALAQKIKKGLNSKALVLPAPAIGLRIAMGEMANVVLNSTKVIPEKLQEINHQWKYAQLDTAIKDLHDRQI